MGMSLELENLDEVFRKLKYDVEVINDIPITYLEDKELFQRKVASKFDNDDYLSNTPRCVCGHLKGRRYVGQRCPECHSDVEDHLLAEIESKLWMRAPNGVEAMINPEFWRQLTDFFSIGNFDVVRYLIDSHYKPQGKIPHELVATLDQIYPKMSYNRFIREFDGIFKTLLELTEFRKKAKREKAVDLIALVHRYRHCLFPQYIPLPARTLSILESSHSRIYYDATVPMHMDVANTLVGIDTEDNSFSVSVREQRTIKVLVRYAEFHDKWVDVHIAVKESLPRRQIAGLRFDFSGRAVITSITEWHMYDEVHIPWGMATGMFRYHIASYLRQEGWSSGQIARHIDAHARKYCPKLDEIFKRLIALSSEGGIPILLGRKPCLEKGNLQKLRITRVLIDPYNFSMRISDQIIKALNADFKKYSIN